MRTCILLLLTAIIGGALCLAQFGSGGAPSSASGGALGPQAALGPVAGLAPAPQSSGTQALVDPTPLAAAAAAPEQGPGSNVPNAVEGTVLDRFGAPLAGERVWLIPAAHGHPSQSVPLDKYITARTSGSGNFSLSLPNAGPWRLAVGPAGQPRIPPSAPREMEAGTRAEITLPGSSRLLVATAGLEQLDAPLSIEVLALMDANASGFKQRGRGEESKAKGRRRGTDGNKSRSEDKRSRRQKESKDERSAQLAPTPLPVSALAAAITGSPAQDPGSADRGRNRRGQDSKRQRSSSKKSSKKSGNESRKEAPLEDSLPTPPRPVWKRVTRRQISSEELETGQLVLGDLPTGLVARLVLVVSGERYEGGTQFAIPKDTRIEVRLFPFTPGPGASFNYSAHPARLAADEAPAGVTWTQ